MKFVGNVSNGCYFQDIIYQLEANKNEINEVLVAVAYATSRSDIFDFCFENKIKLRFWGRYDSSVPVSSSLLETFIKRSSDLYRCYLIKGLYHPKVYWFRGFGVYIGSANIGDKAWVNNVEAGLFISEDEINDLGLNQELEDFFNYLQKPNVSTMLNAQILKEIKKQEDTAVHYRREFEKNNKDNVTLLTDFRPDIYPAKKAKDKRRDEFVNEWNSTLQIINDIMKEVVKDENRPSWIPPNTQAGVQVDQFLHAFYYTRTRSTEGARRYLYEENYEMNKNNTANALKKEMTWWKSTKAKDLVHEKKFIDHNSKRLRFLLDSKNVKNLKLEDFQELCSLIHAFDNVAKYWPPKALGFKDGDETGTYEKMPIAAKKIYESTAANGMRPTDIIDFVLYGGAVEQVVHRLYTATRESDFHISRFGRSCFGEIVGWALPNIYPPRNDRTNKALRGLGYDVVVWSPSESE